MRKTFTREIERTLPWIKMSRQIELSSQAKGHPLFPLLNYLVKSSHHQQKQLETTQNRIAKLENDISKVSEVQKELMQLIRDFGETSYNIEKTSKYHIK